MRSTLFWGILWRFFAWSVAISCGIGAFLPAILISLGVLISGLFLSGLTFTETIANTEIGPLLMIILYSIPIGLIIGLSIGAPVGVINGIVVGLVSVFAFLPPIDEKGYRIAVGLLVSTVSIMGTGIGFWALVINRFAGFHLWLYPTVFVVWLLATLVSQRVATWYLTQVVSIEASNTLTGNQV